MATMVRTQTGTGSYTLSAEEAANHQGLQIVSLAGRQGFASNARVHGFSTASATVTRTSASTGSYTTTQTRTGTYTTTQTRTGEYTGMQNSPWTQTQNRARNAGVGTGKKPFFLKRWMKKLRLRKSPTIRKVKAKNVKLKKKEMNVKAQETQDRTNTRIMTIWDVAAGSPAPDPGDPGGSKTAAVHNDAKSRRQKLEKLQTRARRKSRIMTIWDVAAGSPAPDPGDPGGSSTMTTQDGAVGMKKRDKYIPCFNRAKNVKEMDKVGLFKRLIGRLRAVITPCRRVKKDRNRKKTEAAQNNS